MQRKKCYHALWGFPPSAYIKNQNAPNSSFLWHLYITGRRNSASRSEIALAKIGQWQIGKKFTATYTCKCKLKLWSGICIPFHNGSWLPWKVNQFYTRGVHGSQYDDKTFDTEMTWICDMPSQPAKSFFFTGRIFARGAVSREFEARLRHAATGKLCQPSSKWVPFSN